MSSRRLPGRAAVVMLAAVLAVGLLAVSTRTWVVADLADPLTGQSTVPVPGSTAAAVVPALALVALAAAGALTISRRIGRVVALLLVSLAAVGAGAAALGVLGDPQAAARAAVAEATGLTAGSVTDRSATVTATAMPAVALVVSVLLLVVAAYGWARRRSWEASRRFEPAVDGAGPGASPAATTPPGSAGGAAKDGADDAADDWEALSRGDDPTLRRD